MKDYLLINVGSLSSFNNFRFNITSAFQDLNNSIHNGRPSMEVIWDLRSVEAKKMKLNVLTSFLAIARNLRKYLGYAPRTITTWDPYILQFWKDISFLSVADKNDLFKWDDGMIGGMTGYEFNPFNKITYFEDAYDKDFTDILSLEEWKGYKREEISRLLLTKFENIINNPLFDYNYNSRLRTVLSDTCSELIVNCLLHGKEIAFIGMQRTKAGVSICISDGGVGFLEGLNNNQIWTRRVGLAKSVDAILNASLIKLCEFESINDLNYSNQREPRHIGLLSAINDVLRNGGYVTIHSFDGEIRWELPVWNRSLINFDKDNFKNELQTTEKILGPEPEFPISLEEYYRGYYRSFKTDLKGSYISFEIPSYIKPLRRHATI